MGPAGLFLSVTIKNGAQAYVTPATRGLQNLNLKPSMDSYLRQRPGTTAASLPIPLPISLYKESDDTLRLAEI